MRKMKLGGRIAWSYALLFLTLMTIFIIMLNITLRNENKKVLEIAAGKKVDDIEKRYLNRIAVYSELYDNLPLEFNPQFDGKKITYRKPFDPGEEAYLYLVEIKTIQGSRVPLNTVSSQYDIVDESVGYSLMEEIEKNKITENTNIINQVTEIYDRLNTLSIIFVCIGVAIAIIMSIILGQRIVKPIKNIIKTTEKITTDDLSQRIVEPKSDDELKTLTQIINQMLDRLENSFDNQSKFVSDASHELRTPLAIIKGYAEIIKKRRFADEEIFEESIDSIINETENMKNLVQKLLFLAKGEISKINTNFQIIEMKEFIQQIYNDTEVSTKTHKIYLERDDVYEIKADVTLLQQAIRALLENAMKYSEKGTNIYIKSAIIDGKNGEVSIRDEGVGISEEDSRRIFDRFYRVDDSRTKATGGTGLGLAIVKRIVELHKGEIKINSELGKGTEISIVLPLVTQKTEIVPQRLRTNKKI